MGAQAVGPRAIGSMGAGEVKGHAQTHKPSQVSALPTVTEDFDDEFGELGEFGSPPDFGDDLGLGMFGDDSWKDDSNQLLQGLGYDEAQSADMMNGGMGGGGFGGDDETF